MKKLKLALTGASYWLLISQQGDKFMKRAFTVAAVIFFLNLIIHA